MSYKSKSFLFSIILFSLQLCKDLIAEISSNKFDTQSIATYRGITGQNNFGETSSNPSGFGITFSLTSFYNSADSSWNNKSEKNSTYTNPSSSGSSNPNLAYVPYGALEEQGFWNAAGIFYGMAQPCIAELVKDPDENTAEKITQDQYGIIAFAPTNMVFAGQPTGYGMLPTALGAKTLAEVAVENPLIPESEWRAANYSNYYTALIKSGFPDLDDAKIKTLVETSPTPDSTTPTAVETNIPTSTKLRKNLAVSDFEFSNPEENAGKDLGLIRINSEIKKSGFRGCINSTPYEGILISFKGGVGDLRVSSKSYSALSTTESLKIAAEKLLLEQALNDLGFSLKEYHHTGLEDCYASISAGQGIDIHDKDKTLVATLYPFLSLGVWIPTSKNYTEAEGNKFALYVPMGNEGHTGFSVHGGLAIDLKGMVCLSILGGTTMFNEIDIPKYRMPNDPRQVGLYPFCIDIKRKKGQIFYGCLSLKSRFFEDGVSFYGDLIYSSHKKDSLKLTDSNTYRVKAFEKGKIKTEENSAWSSLDCNLGLSYCLSQDFECGIGWTANIKGNSAPRVRTIFFNAAFLF